VKRIGLISDTHGLLRPEAVSFLAGCDHIIHAGDIGKVEVLERLAQIATLTAVRGNNDNGAWADALAETELTKVGAISIYTLHDIAQLDIGALQAGVRAVIAGHSHKPGIRERGGVLYVNPGSAGPRRFKLPISIGELRIDGDAIEPRLVELQCS
jgi:putative phosphoesterase